jgi:hypothetical protein
MQVALVFEATSPILSPGPTSPRARKILVWVLVISHEMRGIEFIPVNYHESSNMCGSGEASVQASHDKSEDSLEEDTDRQTVSWANPIAGKGSYECARDVKEIDNGIPRRNKVLLASGCMRRGVE